MGGQTHVCLYVCLSASVRLAFCASVGPSACLSVCRVTRCRLAWLITCGFHLPYVSGSPSVGDAFNGSRWNARCPMVGLIRRDGTPLPFWQAGGPGPAQLYHRHGQPGGGLVRPFPSSLALAGHGDPRSVLERLLRHCLASREGGNLAGVQQVAAKAAGGAKPAGAIRSVAKVARTVLYCYDSHRLGG